MIKRIGIYTAVGLGLAFGVAVGWWSSQQEVPQQPLQPAPATIVEGDAPQAHPSPSPAPTVGDPAPVVDPQMDEAKIDAFLRISGDAGTTHQRVAAAIADAELSRRQRVFVHTAVQEYLDSMASYRDQVAAGEMQERDLVFNDEEARDSLDDSLRYRLQDDADRVLDVL